ncbi:endonuclease domain-containing protein [Microbacterium murale]|uniref:DUF559 domain-containing protein n=1 Tax=Microbacterium murale TaxID=1081040 RepID=A0ABQ1RES7_9MICO|nr:hypothetical protein [Microbacterium murale]GGD68157.1 hypothetical protein GCM10007269_09100 [Microbacterium murale]
MSGRDITEAVRSGHLLRLRRDRYARVPIDEDVAEAVRVGGHLSCLSLLKSMGIFVLVCTGLHVQITQGTSRIRKPKFRTTRLHWNPVRECETIHAAHLHDALRQAIRCQSARAALATLDSVLHHKLMTLNQLEGVFSTLPARYGVLLSLVDPTAASGPETFMRLILRALGLRYETQVHLPGVGYVDFLVEGWLIIECDSKEWHEGWDKQVEDRHRDIAAAKLGCVTIRPLASEILHDSARVRESVASVIEVLGPRFMPDAVRNSSKTRSSVSCTRAKATILAKLEEL